ncbi:MAG: diguanylate cyclase [Magnetococcales bacterium]|nr:diguanylate cyclase [Magnetococcales bacterium]
MGNVDTNEEEKLVLIVDDELGNIELLNETLQDEFRVLFATNGAQCIQIANREKPDLILLDIMMPGMDGYEVCRQLKLDDSLINIPLFFITAMNDPEDEKAGLELGADDYITKPISPSLVKARIKNRLKLKEAENRVRRLNADMKRSLENQEILLALLKIALEPISLKEQLDKALRIIISLPWLSSKAKGSIFLFDEKSKELVLTAQKGLDPFLQKACARIMVGYCHCGTAAKEFKTVYSPGIDKKHDTMFDGMEPHGHYCVPVIYHKKMLGVINCYIPHGYEKKQNDIEVLEAIANTMAGLIERKKVEQQLEHLAHHDTLTDLPNRFLYMEHLTTQIARARRDKSHLAVLLIDLDRFKQVNDTLGHDIGDLLLIEVSTRIISCLRESDIVARLGGDEFTVTLPSITLSEDAGVVAKKIISELTRPFLLNGHECNIGSSIGISMYPGDGKSPEDLLKKADVAMYSVKQDGRNSYLYYEQIAKN